MIIFMKQIDKEKFSRELRETTEPVAETEAEAEKRQWKSGGRSREEMIIFMKQIDKDNSVEHLKRLQSQWQRLGRGSEEVMEGWRQQEERKHATKMTDKIT